MGHHPIVVAGGATGSIGDPSGKSAERQLLSKETLQSHIARQKEQLCRWLDFDSKTNPARLVDNADWTTSVTYLEFLREIGKHFTVNMMVAKESVRARMEDRDVGISYTEFSYMLLQAFDFCHLRQEMNCELQVGATDQWGNITAGTDLCRKKLGATVWGLTFPLMTKADGTKYGKTASGAVYLDAKKTSPYRFYQFFIQLEDSDVIKILKMLSFAPQAQVAELEQQHAANPGARAPHKFLARELTLLVHGQTAADDALRASEVLFGGGLEGIGERTFNDLIGEVPSKEIEKAKLEGAGMLLVDLLVHAGLSTSKGQARKDIEQGGININNNRVANAQHAVTSGELLFGQHLLLRKGKRNYVVVSAR